MLQSGAATTRIRRCDEPDMAGLAVHGHALAGLLTGVLAAVAGGLLIDNTAGGAALDAVIEVTADACTQYTIADAPARDDASEPNGLWDLAVAGSIDGEVGLGDEDWFTFELAQNAVVDLTVTGVPVVEVFDRFGTRQTLPVSNATGTPLEHRGRVRSSGSCASYSIALDTAATWSGWCRGRAAGERPPRPGRHRSGPAR